MPAPPLVGALRGALRRGRPSAPGPDRLPYRAGVGRPLGFNHHLLCSIPKHERPEDLVDLVRAPGELRPLALENADAKAVACAANAQLRALAEVRCHPLHRGFAR
eukprot:4763458-Pyramimonas_sp.AAC.1